MKVAVDHHSVAGLAIVKVSGEIDVFASPELRETLLALLDGGGRQFAIDLTDVDFLDSTGLGVLVGIYHRLRAVDGWMVFVCASERVRRVFHVTQLSKILILHDTLDEALEARTAPDAGGRAEGDDADR